MTVHPIPNTGKSPKTVPCPYCGAKKGARCIVPDPAKGEGATRTVAWFHGSRRP